MLTTALITLTYIPYCKKKLFEVLLLSYENPDIAIA